MWKPIESQSALERVLKGDIIASSPYSQAYIVTDINRKGYLTAIPAGDLDEIKMLRVTQLINREWWIKQ